MQFGVNNVENYAQTVMKDKITEVLNTAKTHPLQTQIYVSSVIDSEGSKAKSEINHFIQAQTQWYS